MIQQFYFWVFIQKNSKQVLEETFVYICLFQHYSQLLNCGINSSPSMDEWINQEMETPESWLADEQISKIWCPYTIEYDAVLEEILTYYNMDEPWEYYVKWNKPGHRDNNIWFQLWST